MFAIDLDGFNFEDALPHLTGFKNVPVGDLQQVDRLVSDRVHDARDI